MKLLDFGKVAELARGRDVRLFLDFDGTLSPHRPDGENSRPLPAARKALAELARQPKVRVCVVSGRTVPDVRRRLGLSGISYAGNHGLVIESPDGSFEHPLSDVASRSIAAAADLLRKRMRGHRGAQVSHNGLSLSLNVGLMKAEGRRATACAVKASTAEMAWLRLRWQSGHLGWDLLPEVAWDKGDAVAHLLGQAPDALAIAIGDGLSDESMFERVGRSGISIRVGFSESSKARYWVRGPRDVARLLRALARAPDSR